jgi:hypothetical protein
MVVQWSGGHLCGLDWLGGVVVAGDILVAILHPHCERVGACRRQAWETRARARCTTMCRVPRVVKSLGARWTPAHPKPRHVHVLCGDHASQTHSTTHMRDASCDSLRANDKWG